MNCFTFLTPCLCIALLFSGLVACTSLPGTSPATAQDGLTYGRGGGVAGQEVTYLLAGNGQLFSVKGFSSDTLLLTTISPKTTEELFNQTETLRIADTDFQHPGNLYYFIRHRGGEVVWGKSGTPPPAGIQSLYDSLQRLIPNQ